MKPIKLQFAGLNSYRTRQVVDFEKLGADGLFGIFGPTGSGKSTILDAITLALYGGVDRTINNTRGIIHQLENSLEVAFEFELGGCRYLVDRRYERNPKDSDSAMVKKARLRRLDPNEEKVLASKPQEVNAKIGEILGINREEFSRAVVLPQGKFDQFLRMTGGDRAAMLEHLFNLEQFGEELVAKVKNEAAICVEQLQRIEGEEQGLGDCSEAAINRVVSDLKIKYDEYVEVQKAFEDADKLHKDALALSELFRKRKTAQQKNVALEQRQASMAEKQSRLNAAERAEPLREIINRQRELTVKIAAESNVRNGKSEAYVHAAAGHEKAKIELGLAEKAFNEQLPQLQEKKAQYQGALNKQRKLYELQKSASQKQMELDAVINEISKAEKEIASYQRELDNTRSVLGALQENRSKFMVNPDEKEIVERALEVLLRLEESEKRFEEKKQSYIDRKTKNEEQWAGLVAKIHEMLPEKDVSVGDNVGEWTKSYLSQMEQELEDAREAYQHALVMNSAAELVKELHEGEPCPVCGSREHPLPARATGEIGQLKTVIKKAEQNLKDARNWEEKALKALYDWENNMSLVREAQIEMDKTQQEMNVVLAEFEDMCGSLDREGLRRRKDELAGFERQLQKIDQEREALLKTHEELNVKSGKLNEFLQTIKLQEAAIQSDLKNLKIQIEETSGELQKITGGKNLVSLIQVTDQDIQRLRQTLDVARRNEAEARDNVERLTKEISALEATLTANLQELTGIDRRLAAGLEESGFAGVEQAESALLSAAERQAVRKELEEYRQALAIVREELAIIDREIGDRPFDEASFERIKAKRQELFEALERLQEEVVLAKNKVEELRKKQERWNELQRLKAVTEKRKNLAEDLGALLRGRKFVSFLAQEHLRDMALEASYQLGRLTGQRYALELAKDKDCEFVIRDDYNGGNRRTVNSLSGGEIFMTSLALALALSSKIQLRGKYPLGFFFLDEGFGTLDEEKLDKVMSALEKLHDKNRMVGVISHVRELKERLPRYLEILPAGEDGSGSEIKA